MVTMLTITQTEALLRARFDRTFKGKTQLMGFNEHMWSEGGEWPVLRSIRATDLANERVIMWPKPQSSFNDCDQAAVYALTELNNNNIVTISMTCGSGKSTKLIYKLLCKGSYGNVVCIQPGFIVADELTKYMNDEFPAVVTTREYVSSRRSICYLSAGEFLTLVHANVDVSSALLVLDESHMSNPVYIALKTILGYMNVKIISMTASSFATLSNRKGVNIKSYATCDKTIIELTDSVIKADKSEDILVVGCVDGKNPICKAANHIIGLTLKTNAVVDIGTRIDPTYSEDSLIATYRKATILELTQTQGRLGRSTETTGTYHYVKEANPYFIKAKPKLYSSIHLALLSAFGIATGMSAKVLKGTLTCVQNPNVTIVGQHCNPSCRSQTDARSNSSSVNTKSSLRSQRSAVSQPKVGERQVLTKASGGYMVDNVPTSFIKNATKLRTSMWTATVPGKDVSISTRQSHLSDLMRSHVQATNSNVITTLPSEFYNRERLNPHELSIINDVIAGNTFPSNTVEELNLVQRAWSTYVYDNRGLTPSLRLENSVITYYVAYLNSRENASKQS